MMRVFGIFREVAEELREVTGSTRGQQVYDCLLGAFTIIMVIVNLGAFLLIVGGHR
ncbi:MAG: hypothetical protein KGJ57_18325 [Sphingomonadales bacterium]|nr:hypothetical protein [Sphingomonadales bacterium]MDE2171356.1 hypothetical protein [Sphingomonadales bacterium]